MTNPTARPADDDTLGEVAWTDPRTLPSGQVATDLFGPLPGGAYGKVARVIYQPRRPGERELFTVWNMTAAKLAPKFAGNEAKAREIAEGFLS